MRILIYSVLFFLVACKEETQPSFEVEGKLKNANAKTVYLEESLLSDLRPVVVDSATIDKDGSFDLETLSKEESIYSLRIDQNVYPFVSFVNDSKKITVNADFNSKELYTVEGSPASAAMKEYLQTNSLKVRHIFNLNRELDSLNKISNKDSIVAYNTMEKAKAVTELKNYTSKVITDSKSPAVAMFVLGSYQSLASDTRFGVEGFTPEEVNNIITVQAQKFPEHASLAALKLKYRHSQKNSNRQHPHHG